MISIVFLRLLQFRVWRKQQLDSNATFEAFFDGAPKLNPKREQITGLLCGYRVEEIQDPLMKQIRYLDKLIDELVRGRRMEKILRA